MQNQVQEGRKDVAMLLSWFKAGAGLNIVAIAVGLAAAGIGAAVFVGGSALNTLIRNPALSSTISSVSTSGLLASCTGFALSSGVMGRDGGIKAMFRRFSKSWQALRNEGMQSAIYNLLEPTDAEKARHGRPPEPPPPPRIYEPPPPVMPAEPTLNDMPAQDVQYVAKVQGLDATFQEINRETFVSAVRNSSTLRATSEHNRIKWGKEGQEYGVLTIGQGLIMCSFTGPWQQVPAQTKDGVAQIIVFRLLTVAHPQGQRKFGDRIDRAWKGCKKQLEATPDLYNYVQQFADGGGIAV